VDKQQDTGATPSGSGCQPTASAADASSLSGIPSVGDPKHCDDYIDDLTQPECLRKFLDHARSPAHGSLRDEPRPKLFATFKGKRVRVVMASRFGDVGITSKLGAEHGYDRRVGVEELTDFSATSAGDAS